MFACRCRPGFPLSLLLQVPSCVRLTGCIICFYTVFEFPGRKDPCTVDRARGNCFPEVHLGVGRLVVRHRRVGGDVVRRTAVLELEQPGRDQVHREGLQVTGAHGLSGDHLPANVGLLAEGEDAQTGVPVHSENPG